MAQQPSAISAKDCSVKDCISFIPRAARRLGRGCKGGPSDIEMIDDGLRGVDERNWPQLTAKLPPIDDLPVEGERAVFGDKDCGKDGNEVAQ